jgi:tetrahydromethanopterin S-methyltransferase subunit A
MSDQQQPFDPEQPGGRPPIVGDVVFGSFDSPVAVCTLASRSLLPELAGRPEIAVAGRVFTENVGVEKMVQNLVALPDVRLLVVCGRETPHRVGQTILALHRAGLDQAGRVIGSEAPEPLLPNLRADQLRAFQQRVAVIDMIGVVDAETIVARARVLADLPAPEPASIAPADEAPAVVDAVERLAATRDSARAWQYDPVGYALVFVDRARGLLRLEQYTQHHRLVREITGSGAEEICHTVVRLGGVTLPAHAAYLGRELAKAEAALRFGLEYEQDRPLARRSPDPAATPADRREESRGDRSGNRRAP